MPWQRNSITCWLLACGNLARLSTARTATHWRRAWRCSDYCSFAMRSNSPSGKGHHSAFKFLLRYNTLWHKIMTYETLFWNNCFFQKLRISRVIPWKSPSFPKISRAQGCFKITKIILGELFSQEVRGRGYIQRFRKGVGGRGLATNKPQRAGKKVLQKRVPLLLRI